MGIVGRLVLITILATVGMIYSAAGVAAAPVTWTGLECQATGNNAFSHPNNWDVGVPASADSITFSAPTLMGACINYPYDDVSVSGSEFDSIRVDIPFDASVMLWRNVGVLAPDGNTYDFVFGSGGIDVNNGLGFGADNARPIVTNQLYSDGAIVFTDGQFDVNVNNGYRFVSASTITVEDNFNTGAYHGCGNHYNNDPSNEGGFFASAPLTVNGDDFLDCVYQAPITIVDTGILNSFYQINLSTNVNLELRQSAVSWVSGNNIAPSQGANYELQTKASGSSFEMNSAVLRPDVGNPAGTMKFRNNQTFVFMNNSDALFRTLWTDTGGTTIVNSSSVVNIYDLWWDGSGLITVDNTSQLLFDDLDANGNAFAFHPSSTYDMTTLTARSPSYNDFYFYPTDLEGDYIAPNTDLVLNNTRMFNNLRGNYTFKDLNTHQQTGIGKNTDYLPGNIDFNNIYLDSSSTSTWYIQGNLTGHNYLNLNTVNGIINGDMNYTNLTYTTLPSLSVNGNINLNVGGTPHYVRSHTSPAAGSTVIVGNRSFEWSSEFGVDGYQCQIDQTVDAFASPEKTWTSTDNSEYVNLNDMQNTTDYQWRCRSQKADTEGNTQYSLWSNPVSFFYLYAFQNVCGNGTFAIDVFTANTVPIGTTPVNRTLDTRLNTPINFATFNITSPINYNLSYNDSVFDVIDPAEITSFTNSNSTLLLNLHSYDSPLDDTIYTVDIKARNSNGDSCNLTYSYSIRDVAGGSTNLQSSTSLLLAGVIFIILTGIFLWFGRRVGLTDPKNPEGMEGQGGFMGGW